MTGVVPILVVVPYWQHDLPLAREMAKVMAGMQSTHTGNECVIMLANRNDMQPDPLILRTLMARFNILTHTTFSPLRGWPGGSNGMFSSTMIHVAQMHDKFECVFWMEPDCVPIRPDWWELLLAEWRKRPNGINVVGYSHSVNGKDDGMHINGCSIYHPNFARQLPGAMSCDNIAWDWRYRREILAMGHHTNLIQNRYKAKNASADVLKEPSCVIHGFKDFSLLNLVKSKYRIG